MRFLSLDRKWPIGQAFNAVFYNAIRSVADDYRAEEMSRPSITEADLAPAPDGARRTLDDLANDARTPERGVEAGDLIGWIFGQFKDDPDVEAVIMGRFEGMTAEQVQVDFAMTADEYNAARKRFERWLNRQKDFLEKP